MKIFRSTLLVTATAIFAAACGDKVNIVQPTTATPNVNSVIVSPNPATLSVGGASITMTAAVTADAGAAWTTAWTSSDPTKASVGATTGIVAPLASTPGVAICAKVTATVGTSVQTGCATVVVSQASVNTPASIEIASVTTGTLNTPVNPANVVGQIDVRVNVTPGTQTISKIVLVVGGVRTDSQTFTAAQSAALRYAADEAAATQATFPQILFSINTAAYTVAGVNGATTTGPRFLNGAKTIQAQLYTVAGGNTAAAATASTASSMTFNNVDGFDVSTTGSVNNTAIDANGYRWNGNGNLLINATPIMYSGKTVGSVTATLSTVAAAGTCPANSVVTGAGVIAATTTTAAAGVWVENLTMANGQSPAGCTGANPLFPQVTANDNLGNVLTLVTGGVLNSPQYVATALLPGSTNPNSALGYRWDNVGPTAPTFTQNPNGRLNNWINDSVVFNAKTSGAAPNNWLASLSTDAGVGTGTGTGITYAVKWGASGAGQLVNAARTGTVATNATGIANSATSLTAYCGIAVATDVLGNTSPLPAAGTTCSTAGGASHILFGVDRIPPGITPLTATAGNTKSLRMFTVAPTQIQFTLSDTSLNAASANVTVTGSAIRFGGTLAADTLAILQTITPPTNTQATAWGGGANGYWTVTATASDQAGNSSSITPYIFLYDAASASASGALQTNPSLTAGNTESFHANITDNVDLDSAYVTQSLVDGAAAVWPFVISKTKIQTAPFLVATPIKTSLYTAAWLAFPRGFGTMLSGSAISTGSGALGAPGSNTAVNFWGTDQTDGGTGTLDAGSTKNAETAVLYTAVNLPAAAAWANTHTAATVTIASARIGGTLYQTATAAHNAADTITVTIVETGIAVPPVSNAFSRAELWVRTNSATTFGVPTAATRGYEFLTLYGAPTIVYDGQSQVVTSTYTYVFTPGKAYNAGTAFYGFVGYDSKFNAIITPSASLTIAP